MAKFNRPQIDPTLRNQIQLYIVDIRNSLKQYVEQYYSLLEEKEPFQAKHQYLILKTTVNSIQTAAQTINKMWPDGESFNAEMRRVISKLDSWADNTYEWTNVFINTEPAEYTSNRFRDWYQGWAHRNQEYGDEVDRHLSKVFEVLKAMTGINVEQLP